MADMSWNVPLAPSQTFAIASITKTFTAAAIVRLSEQNRLSLDDTLSEYLPSFPTGEGVTIRQLLSHTAGVSDKAILSDAPPGFLRQDITLADLVSQISAQPSDFAPGSRQKYSNAGYILLGAVIEKVTGASWQDALRDLVIAPAGLQATAYAPASTIIPGRVSGYTNDTADPALANADYISFSVPSSAGGLVSTAEDLNRWMRALNQGDFVSTGDFQLMTTPVVPAGGPSASPYGFGFYVWSIRGAKMVGHTGQINGFATMLAYLPDEDATIVVLANNDGFDAQTLGRRLAAIVLGQPYDTVRADAGRSSEMTAFVGSYGDDQARVFVMRDNQLYSQRGNSREVRMTLSERGNLHFERDELTFFTPLRDGAGRVIGMDYYARGEGPAVRLVRTD